MKSMRTLLPLAAAAALSFGIGLGYSPALQAGPCSSYCYAEFIACRNAAQNLAEVRECVIERNACLASCGV